MRHDPVPTFVQEEVQMHDRCTPLALVNVHPSMDAEAVHLFHSRRVERFPYVVSGGS